jgi:probable F420-dependent oxidoreductase
MRIGAKLPDFGPSTRHTSLRDCAHQGEAAGFDSLWVSDHVVMPSTSTSTYPFAPDGRMTWDPTEPWYDALVTMATAAAVTDRVTVGAAVLIAPVRNPVVLAKQLATLDVLSEGRVELGVGVGWLAEEFEALGAPFERRGSRLDEWIALMRDCWTGTPAARNGDHYRLPDGVLCYPRPVHRIPILVGGLSDAAYRRVAATGDGWLGFMTADAVDVALVATARAGIERAATTLGTMSSPRIVVRIPGPADLVAPSIRDLAEAGVDDVIVNVPWGDADGPERIVDSLRSRLG